MSLDQEYEAAFERAYARKEDRPLILDGWSGQFLFDAAAYGEKQGWVRHCDRTSRAYSESQYTAVAYVLTSRGRRRFGIRRS